MPTSKDVWAREECLVVIWAYHQLDVNKGKQEKGYTQALIRKVARYTERTEKAVGRKLSNVSACDPRPKDEKPIAPLPHLQDLLRQLFEEYWSKRDTLDELVTPYLALKDQGFTQAISFAEDSPTYINNFLIEEGAAVEIKGKRRQRSRELTRLARKHYRNQSADHRLHCAVCSISFDGIKSNREIMHIHHLQPIADLDTKGHALALTTALELVRPVCPSCHAIIHSGERLYSLEEAIAIYAKLTSHHSNVPMVAPSIQP